jgi:Leucine-rich repeat (LRR) protein
LRIDGNTLDKLQSLHLEGSLNLNGFINLKKLDCSLHYALESLDISQCSSLVTLNCGGNNLKELDISNCQHLTKLNCSDNELSEFNSIIFNDPTKITHLNIMSNNLLESDLTYFSKFTNLIVLKIGTYDKETMEEYDYYNDWYGSLEPLKNLTKLTLLNIDGTNIDNGLEYLPESLEKISYCRTSDQGNDNNEITEKLEPYKEEIKEKGNYGEGYKVEYYNFQKWRENNLSWIIRKLTNNLLKKEEEISKKAEKISEQEEEIENLKKELMMEREESEEAMEKAKEW